MRKRKLTAEESKFTTKGLLRNKIEREKLRQNLMYNKDLINKQKYLRDFDDRWKKYLRLQKDEEDKRVFGIIEEELKNHDQIIKSLQEQLKEGVEVKRPIGVK